MYWFLHVDIFLLLKLILISLYIYFKILTFLYYLPLYLFHNVLTFYALTFLYYLHWYFFHHVMICSHWYFYIITFILTSIGIDFYLVTSLYCLRLYSFHHIFLFTHWRFYVTYTYTYFIMYSFLRNDIFILLTIIITFWCIDFNTLTFLYYLHLQLFHHMMVFTHWHLHD